MTEKTVQDALFYLRNRHQHPYIVPNVVMQWGEVDLLSVTKTGLTVEHEIKISRGDFRADRKKFEKHLRLSGDHYRLADGERDGDKCPNYFFYVVPWEMVKPDEIPAYAGLIYVPEFGSCEVVKVAPKLHAKKVAPALIARLAGAVMNRYWRQRLKSEKAE